MSLSLTPNRALAKLRANELVKLYTVGNFATPRHVDFICRSGAFDALLFDLEHFDLPTQELAVLNLVARAFPVTTLARIRASDYQAVMRVLETGVGGIVCSRINTAAEARQVVQWAKFNNPKPAAGEATGLRGWNGGNIDAGYATVPAMEYIRHQNTQTMILAQIENEAAATQAAAIAGVTGIDGLFFAPDGFAATMEASGQIGHERVRAVVAELAQAARTTGKAWGTVATDAEALGRVHAQGARLICPGGDADVMRFGLRELVKTFGGVPARANGVTPSPVGAARDEHG